MGSHGSCRRLLEHDKLRRSLHLAAAARHLPLTVTADGYLTATKDGVIVKDGDSLTIPTLKLWSGNLNDAGISGLRFCFRPGVCGGVAGRGSIEQSRPQQLPG